MKKEVIATRYFVTVTIRNKAEMLLKFDSRKEAESFTDMIKKHTINTCISCLDASSDDKVEILAEEAEFYEGDDGCFFPGWFYSVDVGYKSNKKYEA